MFGFNPFSTNPFSDIGLPPITGVIYAVDEDDTANLIGTVASAVVTGTINTTDENDTANIVGELPSSIDTHDGFTPEEIRRARRIDAKIRAKELALLKAQKEAKDARKQAIKDLVDPPKVVAKAKQNNLQSIQKVKADIPSADTQELERSIAYLTNQRNNLLKTVAYRQEIARIKTQLAILEAKRLAELDDEESLLLIM
jgi:hypothetical protein